MKTLAARLAAALLLPMLSGACEAAPPAARESVTANTVPLEIGTAKGVRKFRVEIARTPQEQARGLMFRQSLPPDGGMIFPMEPPRFASFWMKDTLIPLDIIFIRPDGTIESIAAQTIPYSLEPVRSGEEIAAVLEIAGGRAAELGIAADDKVTWKR